MKTKAITIANLPTQFRGCCWDAGWEFDAPCVIYSPVQIYGIGGNAGELRGMVESYCIDMCIALDMGKPFPAGKLSDSDLKEFAWRGWSMRNMQRRKLAHHLLFTVRWFKEGGETVFDIAETSRTWGPPKR